MRDSSLALLYTAAMPASSQSCHGCAGLGRPLHGQLLRAQGPHRIGVHLVQRQQHRYHGRGTLGDVSCSVLCGASPPLDMSVSENTGRSTELVYASVAHCNRAGCMVRQIITSSCAVFVNGAQDAEVLPAWRLASTNDLMCLACDADCPADAAQQRLCARPLHRRGGRRGDGAARGHPGRALLRLRHQAAPPPWGGGLARAVGAGRGAEPEQRARAGARLAAGPRYSRLHQVSGAALSLELILRVRRRSRHECSRCVQGCVAPCWCSTLAQQQPGVVLLFL